MRAVIAVWLGVFAFSSPGLAQEAGSLSAYIGYYQEDPLTNPEDPVPGSIYLQLPSGDGAFSGEMFFTYIGCQSSNVGSVTGTKKDTSLTGSWSGTVDGVAQSGTFAGSHDAAANFYTGTYTNANGKQHRDLEPCIEYYIAPKGTWALFSIESNVPADFDISLAKNSARWTPVPAAQGYLVTAFDAALLKSTKGNAIVWQSLLDADAARASLTDAHLTAGKEYVISIAAIGPKARHVAFGSKRFVATP